MNSHETARAVIAAAGLALFCAAFVAVANPWLGSDWSLRLWIGIVAFSHAAAHLAVSGRQPGRLTALAALAGALGIALWLLPTVADVALASVAMAWALRSLFRLERLRESVIDLVLTAAGTAFAFYGLDQTASILVATWCYGLIQAIAYYLSPGRRSPGDFPGRAAGFERAERRAREALAALGHGPTHSTNARRKQ